MKYFLHDGKLIVVGETGEVSVLNELVIPESAEVSGGGQPKKKRGPNKKKWSPEEAGVDEPLEHRGKNMLPLEKENKVKELLNAGTSVVEICKELGVSVPTVYRIKKELATS